MKRRDKMRRNTLSIGELAAFARVTRATLLHYDRLGLLKPAIRGDNNYRYYSDRQIATVNVIKTLQQLGMPLTEIKEIIGSRTPESILALFGDKLRLIDNNIDELYMARKLLTTLKAIIETASGADEDNIVYHRMEEEKLYMGPLNDYSEGRGVNDAMHAFYEYFRKKDKNIDLNYPVWGYFSEARIRRGDWVYPDRFYFVNPEGTEVKPAGWYATGCARGNYGDSGAAYARILNFIKINGYEICGPSYEEYPLNEISVAEPDNYLMRISIQAKKITPALR